MKKVFLSLLMVAATMNVMAARTFTAKATLKLTAGAASCEIVIGETSDNPAGVCAPMQMTGKKIAIYAKSGSKKYELFAMEDLKDLELGLMTNEETSYTLTASDVIGTMNIKLPNGNIFVVDQNGASATFTATASQEEAPEVLIVNPIEPTLCHQYGKLLVAGHKGESLVVTDMDDVEKINITIASNNEEVALDALEAGKQYKVILNSADAVIIRK